MSADNDDPRRKNFRLCRHAKISTGKTGGEDAGEISAGQSRRGSRHSADRNQVSYRCADWPAGDPAAEDRAASRHDLFLLWTGDDRKIKPTFKSFYEKHRH